MSLSLLVLVSVALLLSVSLFCFVGCAFQTHGIQSPLYSDKDVLSHPALVAFWPLSDTPPTTTAADLQGRKLGSPHDGAYTSADTNPLQFPCPPFTLDASTVSGAAPGTLTLASPGIVPGDNLPSPATPTPAMEVDGAYVIVQPSSDINPSIFTVEAWVLPEWDATAAPAVRLVIESRDVTATEQHGFGLGVNEDGNWQATIGVGADGLFQVKGGPAALATTTYLALTFDGIMASLFVNGTLAGSTPVPPGTKFVANTTKPLVIGVGGSWLPPRMQMSDQLFLPCFPFTGKIQDVAIYSAPLTAPEVATHSIDGQGGVSGG